MFVRVFLHACYAMRMFTRVRSVTIPPEAESVNGLIYILFSTFVTSKEINQGFIHAVKFMIKLVKMSVSLTYAQIQVTTYLPRTSERDRRT